MSPRRWYSTNSNVKKPAVADMKAGKKIYQSRDVYWLYSLGSKELCPKMKNRTFWLAVAVVLAIFSGWAFFAATYWDSLQIDMGSYGVSFGIVNALFSGIAFAAFVWSLIRQQEQQKKDNAANQFFTLLQSWQNLIATSHYEENKTTGRAAIESCADSINAAKFNIPVDSERERIISNAVDAAGALYRNIDGSKDRIMGHYFRLLYHVVKHIDDSDALSDIEKRRYVDIAVAHMSQAELRLFFYNCLTSKGRGFYKYAEEYEMLENFDVNMLNEKKTLLAYPARYNQFVNDGGLEQVDASDQTIMKNTSPAFVAPIMKSSATRSKTYIHSPEPTRRFPVVLSESM